MSKESLASISQVSSQTLNTLILESIQDIKGKKIIKIDLTKIDDSPTDYFIICEGDSSTQVNAIASNIQKNLKQETGLKPFHTEGTREGKWVLVDYFDTIVHIFHPETREYYDIEDLWSDGDFTEYSDL